MRYGRIYSILTAMKKTLIGLFALSAMTTASAANYVGGSIGTGGSIHYQVDRTATSAMRFSLDLLSTGFDFSTLRLGGSADYLMNMPSNAGTGSALTPYYGAGIGAGVALNSSAAGVGLYPHALVGAKYNVSMPLSVFGELNAGPAFYLAGSSSNVSGGGIGFGWGARLGVNYMLGQ